MLATILSELYVGTFTVSPELNLWVLGGQQLGLILHVPQQLTLLPLEALQVWDVDLGNDKEVVPGLKIL